MRNVLFAASIAAASLAVLQPGPTQASVIFTGSGTGTSGQAISAQAEFDFVTHDFGTGAVDALQITLSNLSSTTAVRGNLLTGLFFSLEGDVGLLSTTSAGFDGLAATTKGDNLPTTTGVDIAPAFNNTPTDGTFQLSNLYNEADKTANNNQVISAEYVIATVAYGLGGLSGSDVNADDFGIFATGSNLGADGLPAAGRLIEGSATFWILKPAALTSLNQITGVSFGYGSLPDNTVNAILEPGALALCGLGLLGLAAATSVRRRKSARADVRMAPLTA